MSAHTPEPWTFNLNDLRGFDYQIRAAGGVQVGETQELLGKNRALADPAENARRIVACVNACEGIPTEHLEQDGYKAVAIALATQRSQIDELVDALKLALPFIPPKAVDAVLWKRGEKPYYVNDIVRAAIAKVEASR